MKRGAYAGSVNAFEISWVSGVFQTTPWASMAFATFSNPAMLAPATSGVRGWRLNGGEMLEIRWGGRSGQIIFVGFFPVTIFRLGFLLFGENDMV